MLQKLTPAEKLARLKGLTPEALTAELDSLTKRIDSLGAIVKELNTLDISEEKQSTKFDTSIKRIETEYNKISVEYDMETLYTLYHDFSSSKQQDDPDKKSQGNKLKEITGHLMGYENTIIPFHKKCNMILGTFTKINSDRKMPLDSRKNELKELQDLARKSLKNSPMKELSDNILNAIEKQLPTPEQVEQNIQKSIEEQLNRREKTDQKTTPGQTRFGSVANLAPYSPYFPTLEQVYDNPKLMISDHLPLRGEHEVGEEKLRIITWNVMHPTQSIGFNPVSDITEYRIENIRQVFRGIQKNLQEQADIFVLQEEFFSLRELALEYHENLLEVLCKDLGKNWGYECDAKELNLVTFYNKDVVKLVQTKVYNNGGIDRHLKTKFLLNGKQVTVNNGHLGYNDDGSIAPTQQLITNILNEEKEDTENTLTVLYCDANAHVYHPEQAAVTQVVSCKFRPTTKIQGAASTDGCFYLDKTGRPAIQALKLINPYAYTECKLKPTAQTLTAAQQQEVQEKRAYLFSSQVKLFAGTATTISDYETQLRSLSNYQSLSVNQAIGLDQAALVLQVRDAGMLYDKLKLKINDAGVRFYEIIDSIENPHYLIDVSLDKFPLFDNQIQKLLKPLFANMNVLQFEADLAKKLQDKELSIDLEEKGVKIHLSVDACYKIKSACDHLGIHSAQKGKVRAEKKAGVDVTIPYDLLTAFDVQVHSALQPIPAPKKSFSFFGGGEDLTEDLYKRLPEAFKQLAKQFNLQREVTLPKETYDNKLAPALDEYRKLDDPDPALKILADIIDINCLIQFPYEQDEMARMQSIPDGMPSCKIIRVSRLFDGLVKYLDLMKLISEAKLDNHNKCLIRTELESLNNNIEELIGSIGKDLAELVRCQAFIQYSSEDVMDPKKIAKFAKRNTESDVASEQEINDYLIKTFHYNNLLKGSIKTKPKDKVEAAIWDLHKHKVNVEQAQLIKPLKIAPQQKLRASAVKH